MMRVLFFLKNIFLLSFLVTGFCFPQKYEISIAIKSKNDTVILGHYFAKGNMLIADTTIVLKNGKGVFKGDKKMPRGLYFIRNDHKQVDFIMGDNRRFGISIDTTDLVNLTRFTNSPENDTFYKFQRYNIECHKQSQNLNEQFKNAATDDQKNAIRTQMQTLTGERFGYIQKIVDENKGLYISKFLNTLLELKLPEPPKDASGRITDSTYVYRWYRAHFFDHLNIYDPEMLRTPFYESKLMDYLTKTIPQHPDTICAEADKILAKARANDEVFRCVLGSMFNHYVKSEIMAHENVWVHIANQWFIPYATWSTADYIETLKKEVAKRKTILIGMEAPPVEMLMALPPEHFKAAALDTAIKNDLHAGFMIQDFRKSMKSKYTVLFFWDYSCGHCKKVIQDLFPVFEEYKSKGLQVITIQTVVDTKEVKGKWIDFVNEHNLFGWVNAWSPYSYKYKELYDLTVTPQLYLLDENMVIIGKRLVPEQIKMFVDPE